MKPKPYTENTREARFFLKSIGFIPLSFYQGNKYLTISISNWANKNKQWNELEYYTFDDISKEVNIESEICDLNYFIEKIKNILIKSPAGQPPKENKKINATFRLSKDVIDMIRLKTNQVAYIEDLVRSDNNIVTKV